MAPARLWAFALLRLDWKIARGRQTGHGDDTSEELVGTRTEDLNARAEATKRTKGAEALSPWTSVSVMFLRMGLQRANQKSRTGRLKRKGFCTAEETVDKARSSPPKRTRDLQVGRPVRASDPKHTKSSWNSTAREEPVQKRAEDLSGISTKRTDGRPADTRKDAQHRSTSGTRK